MVTDSTLQGWCGRLAKIRQTYLAAATSGTTFWARVDGDGDATFENRVKGQEMTNLDALFASAKIGNHPTVSAAFSALTRYFTNATTSSEPGLGYSGDGFGDYLTARAFRVPYEFAECYYERNAQRLSTQHVFPKGTWAANIGDNATAGLHDFGSYTRGASTWPGTPTGSDGALDDDIMAGAAIIVVSDAGVTGTFTGTFTCLLQDATTTKNVTLTSATLSADTQSILGEQAVGAAGAASGQKVVPCVATSQFTAGDWVLLFEGSVYEMAQVDSISENTSLTMESNLVNTFTSSGKIWPLFLDVTALGSVTASSATENQAIQIYARPDRAIAL